MQCDFLFCNHAFKNWADPRFDVLRNTGSTINHINGSTDTDKLQCRIYSRIAAADDGHFHSGVRMGFTKIMRNLRQFLPGDTDQIGLVEISGRDNHIGGLTALVIPPLVNRMYSKAAVIIPFNTQGFFISCDL
ncbi:hypothetical protein D3C81_1799150 [compost metagenome]